MKRVVITGIGSICSAGIGHEEVFKNICEKRQNIQPIDINTEARETLKTRFFVPYPEIDDTKYAEKLLKVKARGSKSSYAASVAALMALEDAGISEPDDDTRVFVGVGAPNMPELSRQILMLNEKNRTDRMGVPMAMQSSVAAWISIMLGIHGKSMTVSMACASGTESIGMGYESILNGKCSMALCGGSDCLSDRNMTLLKCFEHLKAVSNCETGQSLPFSEERSGFLFSEGGASILVVEELEHAVKRNAEILAEITGFESSSDGYNIVSMYYYNAHGTGTLLNDKVEAGAIRELFGSKAEQPAISATKSIIGHTLGASGAIEAAMCVDSIRHSKVHGSICGTVMEDLNISPNTREMNVDTAVSASFGFGGHNAALMISRFTE